MQIHCFARGAQNGDQRQFDRTDQPRRRLNLVEVAAKCPKHEVGEHDGQSNRDHGLPKVLPLHASKYQHLQEHADERYRDECHDEAEDPRARPGADGVTDIAAEQVKRAMRQIDIAHESEDQCEAARHQEIEAAKRNPVEERVDAITRVTSNLHQCRSRVEDRSCHRGGVSLDSVHVDP